MKKNTQDENRNRWIVAIIIIIFFIVFSFLFSGCLTMLFMTEDIETGNVAHIVINGIISPYSGTDYLVSKVQSSTEIVKSLEEINEDTFIKAALIEINSPGGSPVASYEVQDAIKNLDKPTVCWIREVGASGAYWVASACDLIVANPLSIVGSIGVLGSYLEFSGLLNNYNITYQRMIAGKYKDISSPLKNLSVEEQKLLQEPIDQMHEIFLESVAQNRRLDADQLDEISNAMFYTGKRGYELGLVDVLGGKDEAIAIIKDRINETVKLVKYHKQKTIFDIFSEITYSHSYSLGKGLGESIISKPEQIFTLA